MSNETLAEIIPDIITQLLSGVHTAMPGKIESYNRDTFRAEVTPLIRKVTNNNTELDYQTISDVPVLIFGGSSGIVDVELVKGDNVLLLFAETEIGGWKSSKGTNRVSPESLSYHQIADAIAIPCIIPEGMDFSSTPRVSMDKNGTITMKNSNGNIKLNSNGQASLNDHFTVDP